MKQIFRKMYLLSNRLFFYNYLRHYILFKVFVFLLLATSNSIHSQNNEDIDALFKAYKEDNPGIAISVIKDNKVLYQKGYGMANLEYEIPITVKTKFHVASLSKQFTAFMILKLQEEGLLSINNDVREYIPELPDYGKTITIKHLLTHSSGIRDQWRLLELAGWRLDDVIKTKQIFKLITSQKTLNFDPGESFGYSNSGYTLMAMIVERLTNMSFAEYAKKTIFEPLQMSDSFFYDDHEEMMANRAYSYKKVNNKLKKSNLNFATVGPTSLFTTIEDMNKWAFNFKNMAIGNKTIFKSMNQKAKKNNGSVSSYAKGQFVKQHKGFKMIYHSGSDAGYRSYFARFPELGYQFIIFANAAYISAYDEIFKLIDHYLQSQYPKNKNRVKEESEEDFQYKDDMFISLSESEMKKFEGTYFNRETKNYTDVKLKNDTLYVKGDIFPKDIKLYPVGERNFKVKGTKYDLSVNFTKNNHEEPVLELRIPDILWYWNVKVESVNPSNYLGTYYSDELKTEYELIEKNKALYLTHQQLDDIKISQINKVYFSSNNRNFSNIRFQENDFGKIEGFSISNESIKDIRFSKK